MQRFLTFVVISSLLGLAGCAAGLPQGKRADYSDLPGTRDMAKGPGLVSGDHYTSDQGGGTLLYSDDKPQKSLFGSVASHRRDSSAAVGAGASSTPASLQGTATASPSGNADYSDFQRFEAYQKFKRLPESSPQKQRFEDWKKWQQYRQWDQKRTQ